MLTKPNTRLRRLPEKGGRDFATACAIIDAARMCHVGIVDEGLPYVMPMACARQDRTLLLHGSRLSRVVNNLVEGLPVCVTITHFDGLVLARSAFNSSMHYRSVMVFGNATLVDDPEAKQAGLDRLTEHLLPGRMADIRGSTRKELNATSLLALPIKVFTTKVSDGPPDDPKSDLGAPAWAGVVPYALVPGKPVPAPDLAEGIPVPRYVRRLT